MVAEIICHELFPLFFKSHNRFWTFSSWFPLNSSRRFRRGWGFLTFDRYETAVVHALCVLEEELGLTCMPIYLSFLMYCSSHTELSFRAIFELFLMTCCRTLFLGTCSDGVQCIFAQIW